MLDSPTTKPQTSPAAFFRSDTGALVLLGILTACTFIRVLWADFLSYDDPFYVTANPLVLGGLSWKSLTGAWTSFDCANWHPGTWISLMLDYQLFGLRPWGFHLTNLLLHIANTLLLFTLLRRLSLDWGPALFVAAVFGVHPLHVESVAWITERKDVLATLFGLLALLAYVRGIQTGETWRRYVSCGWFALSLTAKPLLVTLPCLLLVLDYWPLKRWSSLSTFTKVFLEKWLFWLLTISSSIITVIAQREGGAVASLERFSLVQRLANSCVSYGTYLQKSFWPTRLAAFYPYSMNRWDSGGVVLAAILLVTVSVLAWRLRHRHGSILLGWLWFLGTLVPMIGLVQVGNQAMADRYMYFPLIGLAWAATGAVLACWPDSANRSRYQGVLGIALVAVMCGLTWQQTGYWRNSLVLSQQALQVTPDNHIALCLHARSLRIAGKEDLALAEYRRALEIAPDYTSAHNDLGALLLQRGELEAAAAQFRQGLKSAPEHLRMRWNLANTLAKMKDYPAAINEFELAELDAPTSDVLCLDQARTYMLAGKPRIAIEKFTRAAKLAPSSLTNQLELALALSRAPQGQGRDLPRSTAMLQKLGEQTDAPKVWIALAEVQTAAGQTAEADATWKRALQRAIALKRPDLQKIVVEAQRRAKP
ncbi:MAG: hypothetical protein JWN70_4786 [Planctomycetaceae bacterium]|nr:hypothetical protein [Planctomycetaceae bacterium]